MREVTMLLCWSGFIVRQFLEMPRLALPTARGWTGRPAAIATATSASSTRCCSSTSRSSAAIRGTREPAGPDHWPCNCSSAQSMSVWLRKLQFPETARWAICGSRSIIRRLMPPTRPAVLWHVSGRACQSLPGMSRIRSPDVIGFRRPSLIAPKPRDAHRRAQPRILTAARA